ncbi:hypothetical protein ANABIO32_34880 [Rossellomorea marisflavi]|nr:hypothetical protein ANABIO32_34880 [Rossellomorea marisflavi]
MNSSTITFNSEVTEKDMIELTKHAPFLKLGAILCFVGYSLFDIIFCIYNGGLDPNNPNQWNILGWGTFLFAFTTSMVYFGYKRLPYTRGKKAFKKFKKMGSTDTKIVFHKDSNVFTTGRSSHTITPNKNLQVVKTKERYLFYFGKGLYSPSFCISATSQTEVVKVEKIMNHLSNTYPQIKVETKEQ